MDLIHYKAIVPPGVCNRVRELGSVLDLARLPLAYLHPRKLDLPPHCIVLLPGYGGGDLSLKPLQLFLRRSGFNVRTWGLGLNSGGMTRFYSRVRDLVRQEYETHGKPVILLGWSLGGVFAREVTRDHPEWVAHVITMGSPIVGGPKYTVFAPLYAATGRDVERIEKNIKSRYANPIRRPVTALFSRTDGIVAWEACIDNWTPGVEHREVACSHVGMGYSKPVFVLLHRLLRNIVEDNSPEQATTALCSAE